MIKLDDWDNDGETKFDWVLYLNQNNASKIYKLGGVSDTGNFIYEKLDNLTAEIKGESVKFK